MVIAHILGFWQIVHFSPLSMRFLFPCVWCCSSDACVLRAPLGLSLPEQACCDTFSNMHRASTPGAGDARSSYCTRQAERATGLGDAFAPVSARDYRQDDTSLLRPRFGRGGQRQRKRACQGPVASTTVPIAGHGRASVEPNHRGSATTLLERQALGSRIGAQQHHDVLSRLFVSDSLMPSTQVFP